MYEHVIRPAYWGESVGGYHQALYDDNHAAIARIVMPEAGACVRTSAREIRFTGAATLQQVEDISRLAEEYHWQVAQRVAYGQEEWSPEGLLLARRLDTYVVMWMEAEVKLAADECRATLLAAHRPLVERIAATPPPPVSRRNDGGAPT